MKVDLKPWKIKPFELIYHGEVHLRKNTEYDKRLALISFDNAIEISITVYLSLHPEQRNKRTYKKVDLEKWEQHYHSKLDFFYKELKTRQLPEEITKDVIIYYHTQRNNQYHSEAIGVPPDDILTGIRTSAIWIFQTLFDVADVISKIDKLILEENAEHIPEDYAAPKNMSFLMNKGASLAIISLIGSWDENNTNDVDLLKRIADGF